MSGAARPRAGFAPKDKSPRYKVDPQKQKRRERVGAFLRKRREELGLTQRELARTLGYRHKYSVSAVENARDGIAIRRVYAWADALRLPREIFFGFVVGTLGEYAFAGATEKPPTVMPSSVRVPAPAEDEILFNVRRLSGNGRARLRARLVECLALEGKEFLRVDPTRRGKRTGE
jgi:transcriptional regulator with XRE-family HTH domain